MFAGGLKGARGKGEGTERGGTGRARRERGSTSISRSSLISGPAKGPRPASAGRGLIYEWDQIRRRSTVPIGRARHHSDARIDQSSVGLSSRFPSSSFFRCLPLARLSISIGARPPPLPPPVLFDLLPLPRSPSRWCSLPNGYSDLRRSRFTLAGSTSRQLRADRLSRDCCKLGDLL